MVAAWFSSLPASTTCTISMPGKSEAMVSTKPWVRALILVWPVRVRHATRPAAIQLAGNILCGLYARGIVGGSDKRRPVGIRRIRVERYNRDPGINRVVDGVEIGVCIHAGHGHCGRLQGDDLIQRGNGRVYVILGRSAVFGRHAKQRRRVFKASPALRPRRNSRTKM